MTFKYCIFIAIQKVVKKAFLQRFRGTSFKKLAYEIIIDILSSKLIFVTDTSGDRLPISLQN